MGDSSVRIGVSACLLGQQVRFDGQHKRDGFLCDQLAPFVTWVPVCPEVEVGMGVPRESLRLVRALATGKPQDQVRLVAPRSGEDWTERMRAFAERRAEALAGERLSGFVCKSKSPSCGLERVRVYDHAGAGAGASARTAGLFTAALHARLPHLPIEEEGRLNDPNLREHFLERVFAYARLNEFVTGDFDLGALVAFHTREKLALLAHSEPGYRALGRLVASAGSLPRATLAARYHSGFMTTLATPASPARHANVLMHMLGHLRRHLEPADRAELLTAIDEHRRGLVPLVVPITLMRHHVRRCPTPYLRAQSYLAPAPHEKALKLHTHV